MKNLSEIRQTEEILEEGLQDPPMVVVLRRTAIRLFPGNQRVALYTNDKLGIEVSVPYEAGNIAGKKLTAVMKEDSDTEAKASELLGNMFNALHHNSEGRMKTYLNDAHKRFGDAAAHIHNAAIHLHRGEHGKADKHYQKFLRHVNEQVKLPQLMEGAIHKLHHIAKTNTDGDVIFKNGSTARVSAKQALAVVKLHKALTPENKTKLENQVNGSPEEMRAVVDFSNENLK